MGTFRLESEPQFYDCVMVSQITLHRNSPSRVTDDSGPLTARPEASQATDPPGQDCFWCQVFLSGLALWFGQSPVLEQCLEGLRTGWERANIVLASIFSFSGLAPWVFLSLGRVVRVDARFANSGRRQCAAGPFRCLSASARSCVPSTGHGHPMVTPGRRLAPQISTFP